MKTITILFAMFVSIFLYSCDLSLENGRYQIAVNGQSGTGYLVDTQTGSTYFLNRDEIYPVRKPNCTEHYVPGSPYQCRIETHYDLEALDPTLKKEATPPGIKPPQTNP
jgi:hypothetical protein